MPLIFALIGTNNAQMVPTALHCVAGDTPPPVVSIVKKLLESLDLRKPGRRSQIYDSRYLISTMIDSGFVFIVVGDSTTDSAIAQSMSFLEDTKRAWLAEQNNKRSGALGAREVDWNKMLNTKLAEWSHEEIRKQEKIKQLQGEVLDVKNIMRENMEALIDRNEKINLALDRTSELAADSRITVTKSTQLRKKLWWNNLKLWGVLLCCLLMLAIVIVALVLLLKNSPGSPIGPPVDTTAAPPPPTPYPTSTIPPAGTPTFVPLPTTAAPVTTPPLIVTTTPIQTTTAPLSTTPVATANTTTAGNVTTVPVVSSTSATTSVAPTTTAPVITTTAQTTTAAPVVTTTTVAQTTTVVQTTTAAQTTTQAPTTAIQTTTQAPATTTP